MGNTYLSKIEIAELLKAKTKLMAKSMENPDKPFIEIFAEENSELERGDLEQYYSIMHEIYLTFLIRKHFTTLYDVTFKGYLEEGDIPDSLVDNNIFEADSNASDFSKTEAINCIRNAICHSDITEQCRFSTKDGKLNIEIDTNRRNKRFHVSFGVDYLVKLISQLQHSQKLDITIIKRKKAFDISGGDYINQIKNNLFVRRIKLSADQAKKDSTSIEEFVREAEQQPEKYEDFRFSQGQASKAQDDIYACLRKRDEFIKASSHDDGYVFSENQKNNYILLVLPQILRSTLPFASVKFDELCQLNCLEGYYINGNLKYNDICADIAKEANGEETGFHKIRGSYKNDACFIFANYVQTEDIIFNASTIFFGYLFDTLIPDREVTIGKNTLPRNKIRNAFEHSRYYHTGNDIVLFDWKTADEYDVNWRKSIKVEDLAKFAEKYIKELEQQQENT